MHRSLVLLSSKSKSGSSKQWLARQARDPYVKSKSSAGYRARSAFKLVELNTKYGLFDKEKTNVVVDLGAAPGGWSQVISEVLLGSNIEEQKGLNSDSEEALSEDGTSSSNDTRPSTLAPPKLILRSKLNGSDDSYSKTIIALDLLPIAPLPGVQILRADFLAPDTPDQITSLLPLKSTPVDLVLSDIASNMSGNKTRDAALGLEICESVYEFARQYLREWDGLNPGGHLVMKYFQSDLTRIFQRDVLKPVFHHVYNVKPGASRAESSETYFVCKGFRGDDRRSSDYYDFDPSLV